MSSHNDSSSDFKETKQRRSKFALKLRSKTQKVKKKNLCRDSDGDKVSENSESQSSQKYSVFSIKGDRLDSCDTIITNDYKEVKVHDETPKSTVDNFNHQKEPIDSAIGPNIFKYGMHSSGTSDSPSNEENKLLPFNAEDPTKSISPIDNQAHSESDDPKKKNQINTAKLDSEHEKKVWWCVLCNNNFHWDEQKEHLSHCMKKFEHKKQIIGCGSCTEENFERIFQCEICKEDITHMTVQNRCEHINRCIDSQSDIKVQSTHNEITPPSNEPCVQVSECPVCRRQFTSVDSRLIHIKKCCKKHQIEPQRVIFALQLQEKHALERIALGLPPLQIRPTAQKNNPKPRKQKALQQPKSGPDSDLQIAMALSLSLKEEEIKKLEMLKLAVGDCDELLPSHLGNEQEMKILELQQPSINHFPGKVKPRLKKNNRNKPVPTLLLRTEEDRLKLLQDRVSSLIAPLKELEEINDAESKVSSTDANVQRDGNNLAEACNLWTLAGSTHEKEKYYTHELQEFIIPSAVAAGSKLLSLSQVPGHKVNHDLGFEYSTFYDPEIKESVLSQSFSNKPCDIPTTQEMIDIIITDDITTERKNLEVHHDSLLSPTNSQSFSLENKNVTDGFFPEENKACHQNGEKLNPVIQCLSNLVGNSWMSDVDIIVNSQDFIPAHQLLLLMRCPIVAEELQVTSEGEKNSLDWSNVSYQSAMEFLNFLYTGSCKLNSSSKDEIFQLFLRYSMADEYVELNKEEINKCSEKLSEQEKSLLEGSMEAKGSKAEPNHLSPSEKIDQLQRKENRLLGFFENKEGIFISGQRCASDPECCRHNFEKAIRNGSRVCKSLNSNVSLPDICSPYVHSKLNINNCEPCSLEENNETKGNFAGSKPPKEILSSSQKFAFIDFVESKKTCDRLSPEKYVMCKLNNSVNSSAIAHDKHSPSKVSFSQRVGTISPLPIHSNIEDIQSADMVIETNEPCYENLSPEKYVMCKLNPSINLTELSDNGHSPLQPDMSQKVENSLQLPLNNDRLENVGASYSTKSAMGLLFGNVSFTSPCSKSNLYNKNSAESSPELFVCESDTEASPICEESRITQPNRLSLECSTGEPLSEETNLTTGNSVDISTPNFSFLQKPADHDPEEILIVKEIINKGSSEFIFNKAKRLSQNPKSKSPSALETPSKLKMSCQAEKDDEDRSLHVHNFNSPEDKAFSSPLHKPKSSFLGVSESVLDTPVSNKSRNLKHKQHKRKLSERFSSCSESGELDCSKTTEKRTSCNETSCLPISSTQAKFTDVFSTNCVNDVENISKRSKIVEDGSSPNQCIARPDGLSVYLPDVWEGFEDNGYNENFVYCNNEITKLKVTMQESPPKVVQHQPTSLNPKGVQKSGLSTGANDCRQNVEKYLSDSDSTLEEELPSFFSRVNAKKIAEDDGAPKLVENCTVIRKSFENNNSIQKLDEDYSMPKPFEINNDFQKLVEDDTCVRKPSKNTSIRKLVEDNTAVQQCSTPEESSSQKLGSSIMCQFSSSPITPMPDYKTLITPELKLQLKKFGVRALSRNKAVAVLQHIYDETHPWVAVGETEQSQHSQTVESSQKGPSSPQVVVDRKKVKKCSQVKKTNGPEKKRNLISNRKMPVSENLNNVSPVKVKRASEMPVNASDDEMDLSSSQASSKSDVSDLPEETMVQSEEDSDIEQIACSQDKSSMLQDRILNYISTNETLYAKILMYEPLNLLEFQNELKQSGIKTSIPKLMDFLDEQCITFTLPRSEKFQKKQQERNQRFRKRVLSKLTQKSSQSSV